MDRRQRAKYDMLILSCECSEWVDNKGPQAYLAMTDYLAKGGRIFGTDYSYAWYRHMTDPQDAGGGDHPSAPRCRRRGKFPRGEGRSASRSNAGLGLHFCKRAVAAIGGTITVMDTPEWPTTFLLHFRA